MPRVPFTLRVVSTLVSTVGLLSGAAGCGHLVESRAISAFASALESNDAVALKSTTTEGFEEKALRRDQAVQTMKVNLDLPTADLKIAKVVDESETVKRVQVDVGETKRKVWYRLKKESNGAWAVDDVFLDKRELANGQSVAARLDLILSLESFLEAWSGGQEEALRGATTPELNDLLFAMPASERQRMMSRLGGETVSQNHLRPDLILREDTAECRLSRTASDITVKFEKQDGKWLAADLALDSRKPGEDITSVRSMMRATLAALEFQNAFAARDKEALKAISSKRFFEGSLMAADLSIVTLPTLDQDPDGPEVTVDGNSASYLLQTPKEVIRFGLMLDPGSKADSPEFRVDDVTLYELESNQNKRLSALFTAHAVMLLFHDALQNRNLKELELNASHDFNSRVWKQISSPELLSRLPLDRIPNEPVEVVTALFQGPVTSITLMAGNQPLTYILRDEQGKVLVDDLQVPTVGQPESFKTTCMALIPAQKMADALLVSRMDALRGEASRDFNRMVWNQLAAVPELPIEMATHFKPQANVVAVEAEKAVVFFGDDQFGAKVQLVRESDEFRVNDVEFVSGPEAGQRLQLKRLLRAQIQSGQLSPAPKTALAP